MTDAKTKVAIAWLRPLTVNDRVTHGNAQSLWGVELNGVLLQDQFTSKRAAISWAKSKGWRVIR